MLINITLSLPGYNNPISIAEILRLYKHCINLFHHKNTFEFLRNLQIYNIVLIINIFFSNPIPLDQFDAELFEFFQLCIKILFEHSSTKDFADYISTLLQSAVTGTSEI